jgi:hypothetical protein
VPLVDIVRRTGATAYRTVRGDIAGPGLFVTCAADVTAGEEAAVDRLLADLVCAANLPPAERSSGRSRKRSAPSWIDEARRI